MLAAGKICSMDLAEQPGLRLRSTRKPLAFARSGAAPVAAAPYHRRASDDPFHGTRVGSRTDLSCKSGLALLGVGAWRWKRSSAKRLRSNRGSNLPAKSIRTRLFSSSSEDDQDAVRFLTWADSVGIKVSSKIGIAPAGGLVRRRVVASSPISAGEVLVTLPVSATCSVETSTDSVPPPELSGLNSWWNKYPRSTFRIAAALAVNRERYEPYIAMLPDIEDIESPWTWPEEHLRYLSDSVASSARARRQALEEAWQALGKDGLMEKVPKELFFRAQHAAASRAFAGEVGASSSNIYFAGGLAGALLAIVAAFAGVFDLDSAAILALACVAAGGIGTAVASPGSEVLSYLPMIDQVNHQSGPPPKLEYDPGAQVWQLSAGQPYDSGDEVVFSYGDKDNDNLLLQHGFVEEDNPNDCLEIAAPGGQIVKFTRGGEATLENGGAGENLGEAAAVALRAADGMFLEDEDAEILKLVTPKERAELIVQWRKERRRLLLEAKARWLN
mmetsp:Transcript_22799/g.53237  ORF Transcript_22799/g.53237 Transcript_22799/m.53237 type:complete len:501 (-) Transcript_22799:38-1540(-)